MLHIQTLGPKARILRRLLRSYHRVDNFLADPRRSLLWRRAVYSFMAILDQFRSDLVRNARVSPRNNCFVHRLRRARALINTYAGLIRQLTPCSMLSRVQINCRIKIIYVVHAREVLYRSRVELATADSPETLNDEKQRVHGEKSIIYIGTQ